MTRREDTPTSVPGRSVGLGGESPGESAQAAPIYEHPRRLQGLQAREGRMCGKLASERARTLAALERAINLLDSFEAQPVHPAYREFKWKFQDMAEALAALDPEAPGDLERFIRLSQEIKDVSLRLSVVAEALTEGAAHPKGQAAVRVFGDAPVVDDSRNARGCRRAGQEIAGDEL
jgi:hypothetical protein